jgi:hypothetical protein
MGRNKSFETSTFPDKLREAQVVPLHKKNNTLDKGNYRDLDNFKILEDIPSFPVAFFIPILLISLLTNSSLMGLKINWSVSVLKLSESTLE